MLVSHLKHFIFLKTVKTAGTSVEIYLEPFCRDDGRTPTHACDEYVSPAGIVGARGSEAQKYRYYNHMPAAQVRQAVGEATWSRYTKVACVRDPFDKVVSAFWMANRDSPRDPHLLRMRFRSYVLSGAPPVDRAVYTDADVPCCDVFLRHETLASNLEEFCRTKEIVFEGERLGRFKAHHRPPHIPLESYYDQETLAAVRSIYAPEFALFDYDRHPPWTQIIVQD